MLHVAEHACEDFRCNREFCIHNDLVCDEVNHCGDGSDEMSSSVCPREYPSLLRDRGTAKLSRVMRI